MNKQSIYAVLGVIFLILFSSCTEPEFNLKNSNIVFIYGKPYAIPKNSLSAHPTVNKYQLAGLHENGIYACHLGDVLWVETGFINKYLKGYSDKHQHVIFKDNPYRKKALKEWDSKNEDEFIMAAYYQYKYAYAIRQNKAGCVKSLNNKEYKSYLNSIETIGK